MVEKKKIEEKGILKDELLILSIKDMDLAVIKWCKKMLVE